MIKAMETALKTSSDFSDEATRSIRRQRMRRSLQGEVGAYLYDELAERDWDRRRLGELRDMNYYSYLGTDSDADYRRDRSGDAKDGADVCG